MAKKIAAIGKLKAVWDWHTSKRFARFREIIRNKYAPVAGQIGNKERLEEYGKVFFTTFPQKRINGKKGRKFFVELDRATHESKIAVSLYTEKGMLDIKMPAQVALGFEGRDTIVMTVQGAAGEQQELKEFRQATGEHAFNYLVRQAEEHARALGFKKARIVAPEALVYYQNPITDHIELGKKTKRAIRRRARKRAVRKEGRNPEQETKEIATRVKARKIRRQMRTVYGKVAEALRYKRKGDYYEKKL